MSLEIMSRVWCRDDLDPTTKYVALALADSASDDGLCWPAVATVAAKCTLSERAVVRAIKALGQIGLLTIHRRANRSSYYSFEIDRMPLTKRKRPGRELGPLADLGVTNGHPKNPGVTNSQVRGDSQSPLGVTHSHPEPSEEPSEEPSTTPTPSGQDGLFAIEAAPHVAAVDHAAEILMAQWAKLRAINPKIDPIKVFTPERRKLLAARLKDLGCDHDSVRAAEIMKEVVRRIHGSPFHCGENDRGWTANLKWLLKPGKIADVLEFGDRRSKRNAPVDHGLQVW